MDRYDRNKKKLTDEEVTRRMQEMLHGGEPRQFGQPVARGFQAGDVRSGLNGQSNQSNPGGQDSGEGEGQRYDVDWLLSQYDAMQRDDEAEARRQRSRDMVNGIADMARALGDLYHTNQYAPSQEVDKSLMSEVSRKRYDKAKAERDKRRAEYMHYVNNVAKQRNAEEGHRLKNEQLALRQQELALKVDKLNMAKDEQEWKHGIEEAKLELKRQEAEVRQAYYDQRITLEQQRVALQRLSKIRHQLDEYIETYTYDPVSGKMLSKERTVNTSDDNSGTPTTPTQQGSSNAPSGWNVKSNATTTNKNSKSGRSPKGWNN